MLNGKTCTKCGIYKDSNEYYKRIHHGKTRLYTMCKECFLKRRRDYANQPEIVARRKKKWLEASSDPTVKEKSKERSDRFYASINGRAKTLLASAKRRSNNYVDFDLDEDFIRGKLDVGICEVTGLPFDFSKPTGERCKNPFAPSIDRIDNRLGYVKSNVRIVLWQVNLMHGELTDDEMLHICKKIIKGLS